MSGPDNSARVNRSLEDFPIMNLDRVREEFTRQLNNKTDSAMFGFVKGSIDLLQAQGKDITKYAIVSISNPMEYVVDTKGVALRVTSQYRVVLIASLQNLPTFDDED